MLYTLISKLKQSELVLVELLVKEVLLISGAKQ